MSILSIFSDPLFIGFYYIVQLLHLLVINCHGVHYLFSCLFFCISIDSGAVPMGRHLYIYSHITPVFFHVVICCLVSCTGVASGLLPLGFLSLGWRCYVAWQHPRASSGPGSSAFRCTSLPVHTRT